MDYSGRRINQVLINPIGFGIGGIKKFRQRQLIAGYSYVDCGLADASAVVPGLHYGLVGARGHVDIRIQLVGVDGINAVSRRDIDTHRGNALRACWATDRSYEMYRGTV